jgi:hypothetical protein
MFKACFYLAIKLRDKNIRGEILYCHSFSETEDGDLIPYAILCSFGRWRKRIERLSVPISPVPTNLLCHTPMCFTLNQFD